MIRPNYWGVVMLSKVMNAAIWAIVLSATATWAQSLSQLGGPVNLPPAGFDGQQFVDNRGCLFLRAGFGTTVNWVPRVDRGRRPLCGFPPTFGAAVIAAVEADMAPDPAARVVSVAPVALVEQPTVVVAAVPEDQGVGRAAPRRGSLVAMLFGTPAKAEPVAVVAEVVRSGNRVPTPPRGYKLAWNDDRLNPMRGVGTVEGQAQQDQVWTRDVPAVLVAVAPAKEPAATARAARSAVTLSTMSAPAVGTEPVVADLYVQVGSFGEPANAEAVKARLRALGLPVSTAKMTRKGKVLQVVYAGPFGSAGAAQSALDLARGAGFGDAILR